MKSEKSTSVTFSLPSFIRSANSNFKIDTKTSLIACPVPKFLIVVCDFCELIYLKLVSLNLYEVSCINFFVLNTSEYCSERKVVVL